MAVRWEQNVLEIKCLRSLVGVSGMELRMKRCVEELDMKGVGKWSGSESIEMVRTHGGNTWREYNTRREYMSTVWIKGY